MGKTKHIHLEIAGEAGLVLNKHHLDAIAVDALEQGGKSGATLDRVSSRNCRVVILANDLKARTPRVPCDRSALPTIAVLLATDVGGGTRTQVGYRWDLGLPGHGSGVQRRVEISGGAISAKRLSAVGCDVGTTLSGRQKRDPACC